MKKIFIISFIFLMQYICATICAEKIQMGENTIKEGIKLQRDVGVTAFLPSTYTKDEKLFKKDLLRGLLIDRLKILHDFEIKYPNQENNTQKKDDLEYIKIKSALKRNEIGLRCNSEKQLISSIFGEASHSADLSTAHAQQQGINILRSLTQEESLQPKNLTSETPTLKTEKFPWTEDTFHWEKQDIFKEEKIDEYIDIFDLLQTPTPYEKQYEVSEKVMQKLNEWYFDGRNGAGSYWHFEIRLTDVVVNASKHDYTFAKWWLLKYGDNTVAIRQSSHGGIGSGSKEFVSHDKYLESYLALRTATAEAHNIEKIDEDFIYFLPSIKTALKHLIVSLMDSYTLKKGQKHPRMEEFTISQNPSILSIPSTYNSAIGIEALLENKNASNNEAEKLKANPKLLRDINEAAFNFNQPLQKYQEHKMPMVRNFTQLVACYLFLKQCFPLEIARMITWLQYLDDIENGPEVPINLQNGITDKIRNDIKEARKLKINGLQNKLDLLELAEFVHLTSLNLDNNNIGSEIKVLEQLPNLTSLSMKRSNLGNEGVNTLASFINIKSLDLESNGISSVGALMLLTKLTFLNLANNKLTTGISLENFEEIVGTKSLKNLTNLTELNLKMNRISDRGLIFLSNLINLTSLNIQNNDITSEGLNALAQFKKLKFLNVAYNKISGGIREITHLCTLTDLDIATNKLGLEGATDLGYFTNLTSLSAGNNNIGDKGMLPIASLTKLVNLNIYFNNLTDIGVGKLSPLTNLTKLDIGDNIIGDEGVRALLPLIKLQSLRIKSNANKNNIGIDGLKLLKQFNVKEIDF